MKKLAMAFAIAVLVSGIVALNLWQRLHTERQQYTALQARIAELEAAQKAAAAQAALVAPTPAMAGLPATASQPAATAAPAAGAPKSAADSMREGLASATALMASPEMQERMRSQIRAELERQFPDLAKELSLSPAEVEKFYDLLAKQAGATMGDAMGMLGGGGGDMQAMQARMVEQQKASEAELSAMLGSRYPKWEQYQGTVAARQQVTQLRAMLTSDNALDEAHSGPLVAALGAETARINKGMREAMNSATRDSKNVLAEQLEYSSAQNERLIRAAAPHLTGPQLDSYKRMLEQQDKIQRMMIGTMSGQGSARGQAGAPR